MYLTVYQSSKVQEFSRVVTSIGLFEAIFAGNLKISLRSFAFTYCGGCGLKQTLLQRFSRRENQTKRC